ncbi:hypothetical protein F5Y14DRAFT_459121 [Nemania sp. NC0429]|nr:hypothetical protein F5Y14DRAFT_459121 [Nemania sp. NC0429]
MDASTLSSGLGPVATVDYMVFTPTCSLPEGNEGSIYVSSPHVRSTLTILWSSLGTIILCTWTILHLSIPPSRKTRRHGLARDTIAHNGRMIWRKFKWVLLALIVPEFLIGKALGDLVSAWLSSRNPDMKKRAGELGVKWTLTHAYFANMGGYILHKELIVRKVNGLPSSQLEITALSFSVCAFITYILLLPKPKDIMVAEVIFTRRPLSLEDKKKILKSQSVPFFANVLFSTKKPAPPQRTIPNDVYNHIPAQLAAYVFQVSRGLYIEYLGLLVGSIAFGAVHLVAWNFEFPTSVEQTLWRIAAVATAVLIPAFYGLWFPLRIIRAPPHIAYACSTTTWVLYIIARLFIIVEVFRSLGYLPPEAFVATWSTSIPHFG